MPTTPTRPTAVTQPPNPPPHSNLLQRDIAGSPAAVTLAAAVTARDNDYRSLVAEFTARTGIGWHEPTRADAAAGTRLSVVIPAHNNSYSLPAVLDALAGQETDGAVQVIVVDDASTDATPAIAAAHPAVAVAYRLAHRVGAGAARSLGTWLADADTIIYLDADMALPSHVLADLAARASAELVLVGFRHNQPYSSYAGDGPATAGALTGEPDLEADHRVRWPAPAGVPMFYTGQIYPEPFVGRPLDHTRDFLDLGHGRTYHDWDLPRMVVTALVAVPRAAVVEIGGFDPGFTADGWGAEDTHLGAALIAAGCKIVPVRQARGFHLDPPDAEARWQAKYTTAAARMRHYRQLLAGPAPRGRAAQLAAHAERLHSAAEALR